MTSEKNKKKGKESEKRGAAEAVGGGKGETKMSNQGHYFQVSMLFKSICNI